MKHWTLSALLVGAVVVFAGSLLAAAQGGAPLKVGDKAPLFTGTDQDGKAWKLGEVLGKQIVLLYFYPKDQTPGCTKEACSFRDHIEDFKKDNVSVVGVSFDSAESHQKFIAVQHLNFPLLADTDGKIAEAYGAKMTDKNMARRVSFLIGLDGSIAHVTDNKNAQPHLDEMKAAIAALQKAK